MRINNISSNINFGKVIKINKDSIVENHHQEILSWDDFVEVDLGNLYVQRTIERISVFMNRHLRPIISKALVGVRKFSR